MRSEPKASWVFPQSQSCKVSGLGLYPNTLDIFQNQCLGRYLQHDITSVPGHHTLESLGMLTMLRTFPLPLSYHKHLLTLHDSNKELIFVVGVKKHHWSNHYKNLLHEIPTRK